MKSAPFTQNDRDLIIALTDDYLNIYRTSPEENLVDVIKLDGFITDGIGDKWQGLRYSTLLLTYTNSRVHPDDRDKFLNRCSCENIIREMATKSIFQGKYRILEHDEIHYYNYKFVKVSAPDEPLRVVAAFRNVDDLEAKDQQRIAQLRHLRSVLTSSGMGTWNLFVGNNQKARLQPDNKMKEIIGIPVDTDMTEAEICDFLISHIHPADQYTFERYNAQLLKGERSECTYRWNHPTLGLRYMRCGGIAISSDEDMMHLNGYHYDVTEQMTKEIRTNHIIKSFAHTYEFINYINLDDDTFFTYTDKEIEGESLRNVLSADTATGAIKIGLREIVSDEARDEIARFSDLSTIDERMSQCNVIVAEFKDVNGIWHESSFTVADRKSDGKIKNLMWAVRYIDNEKQIELRKQKLLEDNIAANKAKTKFLQNMSHEIRTPLNAMFGFAQLLGLPDGSWTEEEKAQYNSYIYNSYNMLDMLISDIIDIADSEHGNYRINLSDVVVNNVCKNALMSVEIRVPAGVKLYMTSDFPDDYIVRSDSRRIQQVLINYLTNACKNTQQGEIHLHCSKTEHPGRVTFSVTDTGKGIPESKAKEIFNRFTKLNQYVQGSGLGLNICQTIAAKLEGDVYLDTSYTTGARFVFVIDDKQSAEE